MDTWSPAIRSSIFKVPLTIALVVPSQTLSWAVKLPHQGNQCIDLNGGFTPGADGRATAIRYSRTGSANQQWTLPAQNQSLILAAAQAKNLLLMVKSLQP